jgi:hypothetical protein
MNRTRAVLGSVVVAALVLGATGCSTMRITMNPRAPMSELANKRIPYKLALLMDSEFVNYHGHGKSGVEFAKLDYDLGSASKALFVEALTQVAKEVTLVDSRPPYSDPSRKDIVIVIEPRITGFSERHNGWVRVANYYSEITYHVAVYDKTGKSVLDKDYPAKGNARGNVPVGNVKLSDNYGAPAEKAMSQAIVAIIDDISKLNIAGE